MEAVLSLTNPVFSCLAFCTAALILKLFFMTVLVAIQRYKSNAFPNPEDLADRPTKDGKVIMLTSESVERVRRNHLNDLENIPAFIVIALMYTLVNPVPYMAILHFRLFTVSRILHTVFFQLALPHKYRALCFMVGIAVTASMAVQILMTAAF